MLRKNCFGKTPINTFNDSIYIAKQYYIETLNQNNCINNNYSKHELTDNVKIKNQTNA